MLSTATHVTHGHSPQAHALTTDSPALSFDPSAWMVDVNCKSVGPNDAWTEVPCRHPTSHRIAHYPSVTTVATSNLVLPLYSVMVEDYNDEDKDPTESPTASPSCSITNESTKPDPPYTIITHCIPKEFKKSQKTSMSKSTKASSSYSLRTKPPSTHTLYGMQGCPTCWNNHFKKCLVPAMNKQFKKNGVNMLKLVSKRSTTVTPCANSGTLRMRSTLNWLFSP